MESENKTLSNAELKLLEEKMILGMWSWHLDSNRLEWSAGMFRMLGLDEKTDKPDFALYRSLVHPDDQLDFSAPAHLIGSGAFDAREFRVIRRDGALRWLKSHGRLVHDAEGKPEYMIGFAYDVTHMHAAIEAYGVQNELFAALKQLFNVNIWRTEADGTVSDPIAWWRDTGRGGARATGWARLQDVHPDDRQSVRDAWDRALRDGSRYSASFRLLLEDGTTVHTTSLAVAMRDSEGKVTGWLGCGFRHRNDGGLSGHLLAADTAESCLIEPAQVRAARAYLGWSGSELARRAGVSFSTVRRIETVGAQNMREQNLVAIRQAFEKAGIGFVSGENGVSGVFLNGLRNG